MQSKLQVFLFRYGIFIALGILLCLHIPFLSADPDYYLSTSRDAHSDEGLNTSQIRNFINHGDINAWECDNLIKNPAFNLTLLVPLFIFGTNLAVARLTVLCFVLLTLFFISRERSQRWFWLFAIPVIFLQFHVFLYSHYSMAEMMATACVLASVFHCARFAQLSEFGKRKKHLIYSILFSSLAWYMKIQFVYISALVPLLFGIWFLRKLILTHTVSREMMILTGICAGVVSASVLFWYVGWYLQVKDAFQYMMSNQASDRFAKWHEIRPIAEENFNNYFSTGNVRYLLYTFAVAFISGIIMCFGKTEKFFRIFFLIAVCWVLLESHKLFIHFVPSRYLVSSNVAMGFLIAVVGYELVRRMIRKNASQQSRIWGIVSSLFIAALLGSYIFSYGQVFGRRTFQIQAINRYIRQKDLENSVAVGPWSPTFTWGTEIKSVPVWSGFLNDKQILSTFKPRMIVSEPNEADSEQAFEKDGINLNEIADSVRTFPVGKWTVNLYWLPPQK